MTRLSQMLTTVRSHVDKKNANGGGIPNQKASMNTSHVKNHEMRKW